MADCISRVRTNYFGVSDMDEFREKLKIFGIVPVEENAYGHRISFINDNDPAKVGIALDCSYGDLADTDDEDGYGLTLADLIQDHILNGDACIITEVGYEKSRYVYGVAKVITAKEKRTVDIDVFSKAAARELLGNPDWDTQMDY